jgi:putative ABC transport system permease protein
MIRFNLRIAFRNLLKDSVYSIINLMGLAVGITSAMIIAMWVMNELSFDKFHSQSKNIYRIAWRSELPQTRTPHPMTYAMIADFPEVANAVSLTPVWGPGLTLPDRLVKYGEKWFEENRIYAADTTFFKIFSFELIKGNPQSALMDVGSIIITQSMAKKYFGNEDPMDKMITINFGQDANFRITGVMNDIPPDSHFHFDFLISYVTLKAYERGEWMTWSDFGHYNYILLKDKADYRRLEKSMAKWSEKYIQYDSANLERLHRGDMGFMLQPLTSIHLHSKLKWELEPNGDITYVYIFSALGILILMVACINYTNLSIAKTSTRLVEIGIKKISGATSGQIRIQFLLESILTTFLACILALILFELVSPSIGNLAGKTFEFHYTNIFNLLMVLLIIVFCGIMAGIYPAVILSRLASSNILKGKTGSRFRHQGLGYALLVFQFSLSIFLIIATKNISDQSRLLHDKKLGFDSNQVIAVPIKDPLEQKNYEFVKTEILSDTQIKNITAVSNIPGRNFNQNPIQWKGAEKTISASELKVDEDFFSTLNLKIIEGRGFSKDIPSDIENAYIINQTAASLFDWKSALNEKIIWYDDEITRNGTVIGVVEDFHFQSLRSGIEPLIIHLYEPDFNYFLIRINSKNISTTIQSLKSKFEKIDPGHPFTYFFLDDDFNKLYEGETRMFKVISYFSILSIIISCVGLFGLSAFAIEKRTKEIGIRKVNGATVYGILRMLSSEYIRLILIAFIIACPFAWLFTNRWLQNFSVKINISWVVFVLAGLLCISLSLLTVLVHAWKAAIRNPVETLRYE